MELKRYRKGIGGWVQWTIAQRRIVYLMVAAVALVGLFGITRMNKDEFPTFEIKQGLVVGLYPGATAAEVETQLAVPLEETLFSFREVIRGSTRSVCRDGVCYIYTDLNCPQSKKDEVWSKIKLKLQERKMLLPAGVVAVVVLDDFSATSAMMIAVQSEDKGYTELEDYARRLAERLRDIDMLSSVSVLGTRDEEIAVTLDMERLSAYGIDPVSLMLRYRTSTLTVPDGQFDAGYVRAPLHVAAPVATERDVAEQIIYADPSGGMVRLKDVARVERRLKKASSSVSYNGRASVILSLVMRPDNDITAFGREVDRVLDSFRETLPASVTLTKVTDQPQVVGGAVFSFLRDLLISMLVVILVMLLLFPLRSALIASSGLPVITAMSLSVMYLSGIDLNTVTLAALIVCLGMIVDDSIITMDGYMDKLGRGLSKVEAACASAKELFMPTFIATLAISLMFFPIKVILTGYMRDFVKFFPWVILVSLMISLLYAVSVVPSLETRFIHAPHRGDENFIARIQSVLFRALEGAYAKAQRWCFRHPGMTLTLGAVAVGLGVVMFTRLNMQMVPKAARDFFVVEMDLESGAPVERTRAAADSLEHLLLSDSRVVSVTSFVGASVPRFSATYAPKLPLPSSAQLIVKTASTRATEEILREYESRYEHLLPSALIRFKQMDYQAVDAPVMVTLRGEDRDALQEPAEQIQAWLSARNDEMKWVHREGDDFETALQVELDPEEAARLGVNRSLLSLQLGGAFNGQTLATLWEGDRALQVNLYGDGIGKGMPYDVVGDQMVATALPGVSVPLRQLATVRPEVVPAQLERRGGKPSVTVYADMKYGCSQPAVMGPLQEHVSSLDLPEGVDVSYGGLSAMNAVLGPEIGFSFFIACLILFVFLLIHFHKPSIALLTMAMSSLCLFGAFLGLWLFNLDFGMTAALGLISLVGIIVRNGILLYEYAEDRRFKDGMDVREAAMEAGKRRMRPIFLTSCTTALGVLPMVIGGDLLWQPMGVVICFGTLLSIGLVVLMMPVSYYLLFRRQDAAPKKSENF